MTRRAAGTASPNSIDGEAVLKERLLDIQCGRPGIADERRELNHAVRVGFGELEGAIPGRAASWAFAPDVVGAVAVVVVALQVGGGLFERFDPRAQLVDSVERFRTSTRFPHRHAERENAERKNRDDEDSENTQQWRPHSRRLLGLVSRGRRALDLVLDVRLARVLLLEAVDRFPRRGRRAAHLVVTTSFAHFLLLVVVLSSCASASACSTNCSMRVVPMCSQSIWLEFMLDCVEKNSSGVLEEATPGEATSRQIQNLLERRSRCRL